MIPCRGTTLPSSAASLFMIIDVHQAHVDELTEAVTRLDVAVREYGLVEEAVGGGVHSR